MIGGVGQLAPHPEHLRVLLGRRGLDAGAAPRGRRALLRGARLRRPRRRRRGSSRPRSDRLLGEPEKNGFEALPALAEFLTLVDRRPSRPLADVTGEQQRVVVGYDIGSTGSKAVALDVESREIVWQGYVNTNGDPVGAAHALTRDLLAGPADGVPGHGGRHHGQRAGDRRLAARDLLRRRDACSSSTRSPPTPQGALHYDPRVDTIFEIGGQDAKYIRLEHGRVIDAAMNEACSAGTGSFIEEQGKKFADVESVVQLGEEALARLRRRLARPALLGLHGGGHRRVRRGRRRAADDHRRALRLDHPELPEPGEGQALGRPGDLLPGHAVLLGRAGRRRGAPDRQSRSSCRRTRARSARSASRC